MVDHHDSYTWNLVHLVAAVTGVLPTVVQHDEVDAEDVLAHSHVVLSPGPGHPDDPADFAVGREVLRRAHADRSSASASACRAWSRRTAGRSAGSSRRTARWRRSSTTARGVFAGLPQRLPRGPLPLARGAGVPDGLEQAACATAASGVVMGVRHRSLPLEGVQFHPESILSEHGARPGRELPGRGMTRTRSALLPRRSPPAHARCFWLDGGGAREWSGRRSLVGWLEHDDVSLTYDAARGVVTRHADGRAEVVGDDLFAVLEAELAAGDADRPVVRLLRLRLPPRPAGPDRVRAARRGLDAAAATCGSSTTTSSANSRLVGRCNGRERQVSPVRPGTPPASRLRHRLRRRSRSSCTRATPTRST